MKFFDFLIERLQHFGEVPLCNGQPDRAMHLFGWCFPLCYRCMFIIIGLVGFTIILNTTAVHRLFDKWKYRYQWMLVIGFILPTFIDGILQYLFQIESTNFRRAMTGAFAGIGFAIFVYAFFEYLSFRSNQNRHGKGDIKREEEIYSNN